MIQDVEDLRPELDIECFRSAMDRKILSRREIQIHKFGPNYRIAASVAQQIGASAGNAGLRRRRTEGLTLRRYSRSRLRQCVAIHIDIGRTRTSNVIVINRIATGNAVRNSKLVRTAVSETRRVSIDDGSGWYPSIDFENPAHLPSAESRLFESVK